MNLNNECCCGCNTQLADLTKINNCPACNNEGISVGKITVEHLVTDEYRESVAGDRYRICMNDSCDVIYYDTDKGVKFVKDQVRVPIWFKKDANPKYVCYCSKVTEEQVIEAVVKNGAKTVKEVNAITGAMKNSNCKENNPLGVCCHKIIQEAIDKGMAMR
ncbi:MULTISPECIES: Csac_0668 family 2Fe-2S cluster-binding (seleno)protein [Acetobacterium]|uniref:(2Fe-2S)-binding protein n=1 Tax=Acetobacterium malicum TaxID=52692 RepID=A0ABR6YUV7_9FIRM|nr:MULTISPECIES: (2Fe-2S)-binding protein [Acetobacterium]MBC3898870.1 (2Fe-2S)-binding protein [Acetobacterium malicum]MCA0385290.1 (2Fe-2S)-binding protein [Bacillota bacterium]URN82759.1 (2Fe-2S)-binding protein [Acetobacterium wieringae]